MSIKSKLKNALDSIDIAKQKLNTAKHDIGDDSDIRKAIRELDAAEDEIQRAIRELKE